jgi:hypothetical protein
MFPNELAATHGFPILSVVVVGQLDIDKSINNVE